MMNFMTNKLSAISFLIAWIGITPLLAQVKKVEVWSPAHSIVFSLAIHNDQPQYTISSNGKQIIDPSGLGLTVDGLQVGKGSSFHIISRSQANKTYPTRGNHSLAINQYNQCLIQINGTKPYEIEVKVFNDGVAFCYHLGNKGKATINADQTKFNIPAGSTIWSQDNIETYEGIYQEQKIEEVKEGQLAGPPLTIQLPGNTGYAAITEGGLIDFAGMSLIASGDRTYQANLTSLTKKTGQIKTPWRVILIGATLNQLVNSDVVNHVSPAPDLKLFPKGNATEWIKPGKSVWSWLAENGGVTFENMKRFSNWAGELGFNYNLVDEGWDKWQEPGKDKWALMKELVDYSNQRGVKVWVWKAYPDRNGVAGIKDSISRIAFFKKCAALGIVGLKIDFFDAEAQEVINFYQSALKDAARFHLMLDFHGADKPTGQSRTWPNEMSREGILGMEGNTNWPVHNTTLVFTRFLAGHADYTPLSFTANTKGTTLTHQVATVAAFTSPLMCLGVDPEMLLKSDVKNMVKQIPEVWDETIILPQSKIGKLVMMARRSGNIWFLIALNGETEKNLKVDLSFLGKGTYQSDLLEDVEESPSKTNLQKGSFDKKGSILLKLSAGGGFIGRFYKAN